MVRFDITYANLTLTLEHCPFKIISNIQFTILVILDIGRDNSRSPILTVQHTSNLMLILLEFIGGIL